MIPRRFVTTLAFALPVLVVAFAVLMGGYALATAVGDVSGASALWWISMGGLVLIIIDLILLVGALGIHYAQSTESDSQTRGRDGMGSHDE